MSSNRLDQDTLFMLEAVLMAERGTCTRAKVGAIITVNRRIVASGYVGSAPGQEHCIDVGCEIVDGHCVRTIHAEANAIAYAARSGQRIEGATLYTTHSPCRSCGQLALSAGISRVVFMTNYESPFLPGVEYVKLHSHPWQHPFVGYSDSRCLLCMEVFGAHG